MNDQLTNLSNLFNNTVIRIPDYQRGYAWTKKEYEDFWSDLVNLESKKKYYAGVITTEDVKETIYESESWMHDEWLIKNKVYRPLYIVDGQQRLTTSILIIQAIVDTVKVKYPRQQLNYYDIKNIESNYLFENKGNTQNFSVKFGYEKNNPSYGFLIKEIYHHDNPNYKIDVIKTKYSDNLESAFTYFKTKIEALDFKEIEKLFTKLTQQFVYNVYKIQDDIDVFVTFETMNNRGKRLSNLELLKNRLVYLTTLIPQSTIDLNANRLLRTQIDNCWKDIYYYLGRNQNTMLEDEEFLHIHSIQYFSNSDSEYFNTTPYRSFEKMNEILLRNIFTPQQVRDGGLEVELIESFINSLSKSVKDWYYINFPLDSDYPDEIKEYLIKINNLNQMLNRNVKYLNLRYRWGSWSKAAMFTDLSLLKRTYQLFRQTENNKIRLKWLKTLEKSMFLSFVFDVDDEYRMEVVGYIDHINKQVEEVNISENINLWEQFRTDYWKSNSHHLIKSFNKKISTEKSYYQSDFPLKYFLAEYEIDAIKNSKNSYKVEDFNELYLGNYYTIEHIYPSNARSSYWTGAFKTFDDRKKKKLRNSLGNLILISGKKNEKLANKSFPEKKGNEQNKIGYKYGCLSEIELCDYNDWSPIEIKDRGIKMLNFLHDRWGIKVSKRLDKIEMLGLIFLEDQKKQKTTVL